MILRLILTVCILKLLIENKYIINLAKHPASHERNKYNETRFHFIREQVSSEKLDVHHCRSGVQLADTLTKPLKAKRFKYLREQIGLADVSILV